MGVKKPTVTPFRERVYELVRQVPPGKVTTCVYCKCGTTRTRPTPRLPLPSRHVVHLATYVALVYLFPPCFPTDNFFLLG